MPGDNRRTRAILPRATADGSVRTTTQDPTTPTTSTTRAVTSSSTRTNIRSACLACRRRRSKCTGGHPCSRCRALETECTYNESQDGRMRALREKNKEEFDIHRRVVYGLFRVIREGKEQPILDLVRNNASFEDIVSAIDELGYDTRSESASETPDISTSTPQGSQRGRALSQQSNLQSDFNLMSFDKMQDATISPDTDGVDVMGSSSARTNPFYDDVPDSPTNVMGYRHLLKPLHKDDELNHPLNNVYIDFRNLARTLIYQQDIPATSILGEGSIACGSLFRSDALPGRLGVATWASAIVKSVPGPDILFRLAWLCYITRFMRWAVQPSSENFQLMPAAMMPTDMQVSVEHAPVIDLIPIPQVRDLTIQRSRDFFKTLEICGATVHWTESISDAIDHNPMTGALTVSTRFESHVSNVNNLCFGRRVLDLFPELEGQLIVAEQDQLLSVSASTTPGPQVLDLGPEP